MKNQNDLIIAVVSIVFGLIGVGVAYGTRPAPKAAAMPTKVDLSPPVIKNAEVPMVNGLGGGKNAGGAAGGPQAGPTAAGQSGAGGNNEVPFDRRGPTAAGTSSG
ncbi:MAG: hypothetical protein ABL949_07605 [Fimbriimonadaceae bacterium]